MAHAHDSRPTGRTVAVRGDVVDVWFPAAIPAVSARLETGPTDTNVTDLHLLAVEGKSATTRRKR